MKLLNYRETFDTSGEKLKTLSNSKHGNLAVRLFIGCGSPKSIQSDDDCSKSIFELKSPEPITLCFPGKQVMWQRQGRWWESAV